MLKDLDHLQRRMVRVAFSMLLGITIWSGRASAEPTSATTRQFSLAAEPALLTDYPKYVSTTGDEWHMVARLGLWATAVSGDLSVGPVDADFDMDFSDLLEELNFAFMGGVEISRGKWVFALNGVLAQLEDSASSSRTRLINGAVVERGADMELDLYVGDLAAGYRLFDIPVGSGKDSVLSITPAVGVRYTYFDLSVNPDNFETRSSTTELWDPYIGGQVYWQFSRKLAWRTDASIGGFGVGSRLAWTAESFIDWRFHRNFELNLGYRAMYWDYEDGDVELDMTMHGPWIGLSIYLR